MADFCNFHVCVFCSSDGESPTTIYTQTYSTPESARALVGGKGTQKTLIGHANTGTSLSLSVCLCHVCLSLSVYLSVRLCVCLSFSHSPWWGNTDNSDIKHIKHQYNETLWDLMQWSRYSTQKWFWGSLTVSMRKEALKSKLEVTTKCTSQMEYCPWNVGKIKQ